LGQFTDYIPNTDIRYFVAQVIKTFLLDYLNQFHREDSLFRRKFSTTPSQLIDPKGSLPYSKQNDSGLVLCWKATASIITNVLLWCKPIYASIYYMINCSIDNFKIIFSSRVKKHTYST